jgi:hypothetical protein
VFNRVAYFLFSFLFLIDLNTTGNYGDASIHLHTLTKQFPTDVYLWQALSDCYQKMVRPAI